MEKEKFGGFIAAVRKESGMTQKELADKLLISDKAVSKWERGLSFPDITMLEPLSKILSVSVTELVECRMVENNERFEFEQTENLIKETISINEEQRKSIERERRHDRILIAIFMCVLGIVESVVVMLTCSNLDLVSTVLLTPEALFLFFGLYFWVFIKDELPTYYDENRISFFTDGFMKISMPGMYFNNSNWKHITKAVRMWAVIGGTLYPALIFLQDRILDTPMWVMFAETFIFAFSVFIPIYVAGKKYK